jgi:hypothetical protein
VLPKQHHDQEELGWQSSDRCHDRFATPATSRVRIPSHRLGLKSPGSVGLANLPRVAPERLLRLQCIILSRFSDCLPEAGCHAALSNLAESGTIPGRDATSSRCRKRLTARIRKFRYSWAHPLHARQDWPEATDAHRAVLTTLQRSYPHLRSGRAAGRSRSLFGTRSIG